MGSIQSSSSDSTNDDKDECKGWKIGFGITTAASVCLSLSCVCILIIFILSMYASFAM
jgi:hypothetical protein